MMEEFTDVNGGEKAMMKLWNKFMLEQNQAKFVHYSNDASVTNEPRIRGRGVVADSRMGELCELFVRQQAHILR